MAGHIFSPLRENVEFTGGRTPEHQFVSLIGLLRYVFTDYLLDNLKCFRYNQMELSA